MQVFRNITLYSPKHGGNVSVRVDLDIDIEAIARDMGHRALQNKSGRSNLAVGIKAEAKVRDAAR